MRKRNKPKRSIAPRTKSEREIITNKTRRRVERKASKHKHRLLEEAE